MREKMNIISALTVEEKAQVFDRLIALKESEDVVSVVLSVACDVAAEVREKKRTALGATVTAIEGEIDIFNFAPYQREYEAFAVHYSGLELMLRCAIFLSYKYNHLSPENRDLVRIQKSKKTNKTLLVTGKVGKVIPKSWFDDITDTFEPRYLLEKWYAHFAPEKENAKKVIKNALVKYHNYEDFIFNKLYCLYVDSEYVMTPLWFSRKKRLRSDGTKELMSDYYARKA